MAESLVHGNYHGYYSKRPAVHDPRLARLSPAFFAGKRVLDIGCNEGRVTCEIGQTRDARRVVGIDIDETLIRAAWKWRRSVWSQQYPEGKSFEDSQDNDCPSTISQRNEPEHPLGCRAVCFDYFPMSCEQTHGPLPIPSHTTGYTGFPYNVTFRVANWITEDDREDELGCDIILGFSITKWIHLNYGDDGISQFFSKVYRTLGTGGIFVLEPQLWETYGKAKRVDERLRQNFEDLRLRPEDFPTILREAGFGPQQQLGSVGEGGFHRPIDLYVKP